MGGTSGCVLILGSAPDALTARGWDRAPFTHIVAINNAWAIRPDWDFHIHPEDFCESRRPRDLRAGQRRISHRDYVPVQNRFGGFVYGGGTMAFTAGYWALGALAPAVIAFIGCDMIYRPGGATHFYGTGTADPLRPDVSLRSLEAKSARLALIAAGLGCVCVNLSQGESRLVFPRAAQDRLTDPGAVPRPDPGRVAEALRIERELGYIVPSGRYWESGIAFDTGRIDALDALWLDAFATAVRDASLS